MSSVLPDDVIELYPESDREWARDFNIALWWKDLNDSQCAAELGKVLDAIRDSGQSAEELFGDPAEFGEVRAYARLTPQQLADSELPVSNSWGPDCWCRLGLRAAMRRVRYLDRIQRWMGRDIVALLAAGGFVRWGRLGSIWTPVVVTSGQGQIRPILDTRPCRSHCCHRCSRADRSTRRGGSDAAAQLAGADHRRCTGCQRFLVAVHRGIWRETRSGLRGCGS